MNGAELLLKSVNSANSQYLNNQGASILLLCLLPVSGGLCGGNILVSHTRLQVNLFYKKKEK